MPLLVAHGIVVWRAWRSAPHLRAGVESGPLRPLPRPARGRAAGLRRRGPCVILLPIVLAGLVALLAYLAGTPFTILDFPKWLADFRTQASFVDEGWEGQAKLPPGVPYLLALGAGSAG